tara:strand:- start:291 stop:443 length:153 start_codon:yes stop_codon:yes gene_type:complete
MGNYTGWELSTGLVNGFLFGFRTYENEDDKNIDYVFYLFMVDICLTFYYD